jgi:hypothetical protein
VPHDNRQEHTSVSVQSSRWHTSPACNRCEHATVMSMQMPCTVCASYAVVHYTPMHGWSCARHLGISDTPKLMYISNTPKHAFQTHPNIHTCISNKPKHTFPTHPNIHF